MTTVMIEAPVCAPERTRAQRFEALDRANAVRTARKELKQQLHALPSAASTQRVAMLVRQPLAGVTETMKVYDLLTACRGMGQSKANQLLRRLHISPSKTIGGLTPRQRQQLGVALEELARHRLLAGRRR